MPNQPRRRLSRRQFVARTALTATAALAAPYVHGASVGGRLHVGFWDHWVPGANEPLARLCREWAAREKVELALDFITSNGNKNLLTIAAEAQARTGHDILSMPTWYAAGQADKLEPVDDIMAELIAKNGRVDFAGGYLGKQDGHWIAVPGTWGNATFPCVGRIDQLRELAGLDVMKIYPAGQAPDRTLHDAWTWDAFLAAAEKCHKAGYPFGMPMSDCTDAVNWVGSVFAAYGAEMVDEQGHVRVKSEQVRQVVEWFKRLVPVLPPETWSWDNASNNKWLISGRGALIMNPPSAWAVAKRDAPKIAEQTWHFPPPKGPKGRFAAGSTNFWAIWSFSKNKAAAKSLLMFLADRPQAEKLVEASEGFDVASFVNQLDFKTWSTQGPPAGTLWHYPPRGDVVVSISGAPSPTRIGTQMFAQATMTKMIAQATVGKKSVDDATDWAAGELDGFMRS